MKTMNTPKKTGQ